MDPRSNNNSGLGLPQPGGSDMGQLPPIHAPQSFHAPDTAATHFDTAPAQLGAVAPTVQQVPVAAAAAPATLPGAVAITPGPISPGVQPSDDQPTAAAPATQPLIPADPSTQVSVAPIEDTDTNFDEEWVGKARDVIANTRNDPYIQSRELGKLLSLIHI